MFQFKININKIEGQGDGRLGGCGVHFTPRMHQEYIFSCRRSHRAPVERWQESLVLRKKYISKFCLSDSEVANLWQSEWRKNQTTMYPHSSNLAWKIPWPEEPGRLQSLGLQRVRHDWAIITPMHPGQGWKSTGCAVVGSCSVKMGEKS